MDLLTIPCGILQANMYVMYDDYKDAIVIDPSDFQCLKSALDSTSLSLKAVLLTHAHFDHASALREISDFYNVPSYLHQDDVELLSDPFKNASLLIGRPIDLGSCSNYVKNGDRLTFGDISVFVLHTPGHSRGSVCYLIGDSFLFTGDTLFAGGIGRCDLYGGDPFTIQDSLRKLAMLNENYQVLPGHGPQTTLFYEKSTNPYMNL